MLWSLGIVHIFVISFTDGNFFFLTFKNSDGEGKGWRVPNISLYLEVLGWLGGKVVVKR